MIAGLVVGAALLASATPVAAVGQGDWLVRGRLVAVAPQDDSGVVFVGGAPLVGSEVSVDNGYTLDIDFTYMFTDNIGAELLLDVTSEHDVDSGGTLASIVPGKLASVRVLPPSLILQYHFRAGDKFKPYVGAGLNYTTFLNEKASDAASGILGMSDLDLDDSFGFVLQLGADYQIDDRWYLNADIKYIDLSTTATANSLVGPIRVDVDIDPLLFGVGVGYRF
jgi:outer membrane protein